MDSFKTLSKTGMTLVEAATGIAKIFRRLNKERRQPSKPVQKPKVNRQDAFKQVEAVGSTGNIVVQISLDWDRYRKYAYTAVILKHIHCYKLGDWVARKGISRHTTSKVVNEEKEE
ncbi:hypothetical protein JRB95_001360 [Listeria monocytogenes]|nr:hypothetical protein [Listeria monocytogenes]